MRDARRHLTYANVVATLALIVAVAGGSTAIAISAKVKKNSVGSKQIKNGSIRAEDLAGGAVASDKLAPGSVTASKLTGTTVVSATSPTGGGVSVDCPAGTKLLSVGGETNGQGINSLLLKPNGGESAGVGTTSGPATRADVLCLKSTPGG